MISILGVDEYLYEFLPHYNSTVPNFGQVSVWTRNLSLTVDHYYSARPPTALFGHVQLCTGTPLSFHPASALSTNLTVRILLDCPCDSVHFFPCASRTRRRLKQVHRLTKLKSLWMCVAELEYKQHGFMSG